MTINLQIQNLLQAIASDRACAPEALFDRLSRLLDAPAPANSCALPGSVGEVIGDIATEFGLTCAPIGSTGVLAIALGDPNAPLDLLISAHMDRPCYRVLNLPDATLYPLCAIRVPGDGYECAARALRYVDGRVRVTANGVIRFQSTGNDYRITFRAETGELAWGDIVMAHTTPKVSEGSIIGSGFDNAIGVLLLLVSAHLLNKHVADTFARRRVIFVFTDQEEGPPIGLFGQGASRLAHVLEPPRLGFVNVDGHNLDEAAGHVMGVGASHAFVSGDGRGSVVPLDYQALAESLAGEVNKVRPGTVRLNYSYVSRGDDMLLSTWTRCLGLSGVIVANAHTTEETVALSDLSAAVRWISALATRLLESKRN